MPVGFPRIGWPTGSEAFLSVADFVADATPHTKGGWIEIDASTARDVCGIWLAPDNSIGVSNTLCGMLLDIGIGGAGSEVAIVSNVSWGNYGLGVPQYLPIHIPAGTRVAARIQATVTVDVFAPVVVLCFADRLGSFRGYSIADTIGVNTATSLPTTGDLTDNAWDEAVASTAQDYRALSVHFALPDNAATGGNFGVDIGVGAGGAEQVLGSWIVLVTSSSEIIQAVLGPPFIECDIPAGSRLAIRKNTTQDLSAHLIGWR